MSGLDFDRQRMMMVTNQLRTNAVTDGAVLAAMAAVPRERFIGGEQGAIAYRDTIVPLGEGRGLNPPIATGRLLTAARPRAGEQALVIGAGTGYTAALLAEIGCVVVALEQSPALLARARATLEGVAAVSLVEGPLAEGWAEGAPYALIVLDGGVEIIPQPIIDQLAEGGRMVGARLDRGVSRLFHGGRQGQGFGITSFADVETAPLPGFAPAPAFSF